MTVSNFDANEDLFDPIIGISEASEYLATGSPMARIWIKHPETSTGKKAKILMSERQLAAFITQCQEMHQTLIRRREYLEARDRQEKKRLK